MHRQLKSLEAALARADQVLSQAESSGMEVSQARLDRGQARDALTKARVTIHAFQVARVAEDIGVGVKGAEQTYQAGVKALVERDYRRKGLAVSLITILVVLIGLRLYILHLEAREPAP